MFTLVQVLPELAIASNADVLLARHAIILNESLWGRNAWPSHKSVDCLYHTILGPTHTSKSHAWTCICLHTWGNCSILFDKRRKSDPPVQMWKTYKCFIREKLFECATCHITVAIYPDLIDVSNHPLISISHHCHAFFSLFSAISGP